MTVAHVAREFHVLPSDVLAKSAEEFQIDITAARLLWEWDEEMRKQAEARARAR